MIDRRYAKDGARGAAFASVQPLVAYAAATLDDDVSLTALAGKAGLSAFHLHRIFSAAVGETPKQLTMRLRLALAAATLLTTDDSVLSVALSCGFQSHEVFIRAFRRLVWHDAPAPIAGAALPTASPLRRLGSTPRS